MYSITKQQLLYRFANQAFSLANQAFSHQHHTRYYQYTQKHVWFTNILNYQEIRQNPSS